MKIGLIVLAAGYSERMGVLKPLLPVGEVSALHRAVGIGKTEKVHIISVVMGFRCEDIQAELLKYRAKNIRMVNNTRFDEGMFSSVKAGVHSLPADLDGFLLLPADVCAVQPDTLEKIIAAFVLEDGASVLYPTFRGRRGHPPLIPYALAAGIKSYDGENGMQGYLSQFPSSEVEVGDAAILMDMDTPADYAALLRHLGLPTYPDKAGCLALMEAAALPQNIREHSLNVRALALRAAELLRSRGIGIDENLLSSACLLHDIARLEPEHETAGAQLLLREGYPSAAMLVAAHMDLPGDYIPKPDEMALLYLADKLSRGAWNVTPEVRLDMLRAHLAGNPEALRNAERRLGHAQAILDMLSEKYGISYRDIVPAPPE